MIEIYMNDGIMKKNKCANRKKQESWNFFKMKKWRKKLKSWMLKEKARNHMEDHLCVGVFIVSMMMQKLTLKIHKSCVVSFVINNL
jgi:hypothetical protein